MLAQQHNMSPSPSSSSQFQFHHYITPLAILLLFQLCNSYSILVTSVNDSKTIYYALKAHGLPIGLFPKGVTNFTIDDETGEFQVYLDQACNAKFESQLHYDRNVSGVLSYGQISSLSGISAQELFLWFPVNGIHVDIPSSGIIYFDVGVVFKQLALSLFETPPECTAVSPVSPPEFGDGLFVAEALSKGQNEKLRDQFDQGGLVKAVL